MRKVEDAMKVNGVTAWLVVERKAISECVECVDLMDGW